MGDVEKRWREEEAFLQMSKVTKLSANVKDAIRQIPEVAKLTPRSTSILFNRKWRLSRSKGNFKIALFGKKTTQKTWKCSL